MSVLEIVLLVVGALIFIGSFVVPVKKEELQEETIRLAEDEVKNLVAKEMEQAKRKMSEMSEDACQEQVQKAERSMERISNEKIMAVNEYSDTVLEEIHKNGQIFISLNFPPILKNNQNERSLKAISLIQIPLHTIL